MTAILSMWCTLIFFDSHYLCTVGLCVHLYLCTAGLSVHPSSEGDEGVSGVKFQVFQVLSCGIQQTGRTEKDHGFQSQALQETKICQMVFSAGGSGSWWGILGLCGSDAGAGGHREGCSGCSAVERSWLVASFQLCACFMMYCNYWWNAARKSAVCFSLLCNCFLFYQPTQNPTTQDSKHSANKRSYRGICFTPTEKQKEESVQKSVKSLIQRTEKQFLDIDMAILKILIRVWIKNTFLIRKVRF